MIDDSIAYSSSLFFPCWLDSKPSAGKVRQPRLLSFIEWDKECQEELKGFIAGLGQPDCCLFGDITAFFRPELNDIIQELKRKPSMHVLFGTKMIALLLGCNGVLHVLQNKWNCSDNRVGF